MNRARLAPPSSPLPACGERAGVGGRSAVAQFGVEGVAQGVAEEAEAEDGQRDRQAREDAIQGAVDAYSSAPPCSISPQAGTGSCTPRPR